MNVGSSGDEGREGRTGIRSRDDYLRYLEADRRAMGRATTRPRLAGDETWRFLRLLRAVEYVESCRRAWYHRPLRSLLSLRFHRASIRLGFTIPPYVCGPGLVLPQRGTIVVNSCARIGAYCRIHACVNIGTSAGKSTDAPTIGDNVTIGNGAVIYGDITIADDIMILPKAVVNRSFLEPGITIAGRPARQVRHEDEPTLHEAGEPAVRPGSGDHAR